MLYRSIIWIQLVVVSLRAGPANAQEYGYSADAEAQFATGLQHFSEHRFREAASLFESLHARFPIHQRTTAAFVMAAKAFFRLQEYTRVREITEEFLKEYPTSSYRSDALYLLGMNSLMFERNDAALEYFLASVTGANDASLRRDAGQMAESVAIQRVAFSELERLFHRTEGGSKKAYLALFLAEKCAVIGENPRAREFLRSVSIADTSGDLAKRFRMLERRLTAGIQVKIGALLPSKQSAAKGVADEIYEGIQAALSEFSRNPRSASGVALELRDTDQDSSHLLEPMNQLADMSDVIAVVGPLFSQLATMYAPVANAAGISLISPTATANGIAAAGPYVFQANPDFEMRGRAMARYAVQRLGFSTLAVLSSSDPKATAVGDAFADEAAKLGAAVVACETYGKDMTDLRAQLMAIRRTQVLGGPRISFAGKVSAQDIQAMLKAGANRSLLEYARRRGESVELMKLFGPRGDRIADSLQLRVIAPEQQFFSLEIPVTTIDGLFISLTTSEEISVVAPQISYFNFKTQILGSAEWYDRPLLEANKRYTSGAMFVSDSYTDKNNPAYAEFEKTFKLENGKLPTKNTLYGYDTMMMILNLISEGASTREQLAEALRAVERYPGLHAPISLTNGRVNANLHVLKYDKGEITLITEVPPQ